MEGVQTGRLLSIQDGKGTSEVIATCTVIKG